MTAGSLAWLTVVLPLHDAAAYVDDVLVRVGRLADAGAEVLVVDDGSRDTTGASVGAAAAAHPGVVAVLLEENVGVARARNVALGRATREYVWLVDGDDVWAPDVVDLLTRVRGEDGADVIAFGADRCGTDGRLRRADTFAAPGLYSREEALSLLASGGLHGFLWSKLVRRAVLPPDPFPATRSQSDFVGVVAILDRSSSVRVVGETLYRHVERDGSITRSRAADASNLLRAHDALLAVADLTEAERRAFSLWFYLAPSVATALRTEADDAEVARLVGDLRAATTWRDVALAAPAHPRAAAVTGAVRLLGPAFPPIYRRLRQGRAALRRGVTSRGPHR
ncbi:hypothetical protein C8046_16075 [Serinibacter arcticus]|uniref:Glycosyltransferase 2-like domain-containing protein n=1 Tax=Serinibacter arcticus TaxID=1655435 RepID=A0A2U1ZY70_9MICO|nr:glycosyltransferase family 2 protein [Serinibacter arcticus]PWD51937.1 hypothetical protein C8046_16075 [Serinibacter arcticus]